MSERTALYRLYDSEGRLLYVGVTKDVRRRFYVHKFKTPWWHQVSDHTVVWYDTRSEAHIEEARQVAAENPPYNKPVNRGPFLPLNLSEALWTRVKADAEREGCLPVTVILNILGDHYGLTEIKTTTLRSH